MSVGNSVLIDNDNKPVIDETRIYKKSLRLANRPGEDIHNYGVKMRKQIIRCIICIHMPSIWHRYVTSGYGTNMLNLNDVNISQDIYFETRPTTCC